MSKELAAVFNLINNDNRLAEAMPLFKDFTIPAVGYVAYQYANADENGRRPTSFYQLADLVDELKKLKSSSDSEESKYRMLEIVLRLPKTGFFLKDAVPNPIYLCGDCFRAVVELLLMLKKSNNPEKNIVVTSEFTVNEIIAVADLFVERADDIGTGFQFFPNAPYVNFTPAAPIYDDKLLSWTKQGQTTHEADTPFGLIVVGKLGDDAWEVTIGTGDTDVFYAPEDKILHNVEQTYKQRLREAVNPYGITPVAKGGPNTTVLGE